MHAYGISYLEGDSIRRECWHQLPEILDVVRSLEANPPRILIGHCRYSTSGDFKDHRNNQPIVAAGLSLVFNGVISMKLKSEFEAEFGVKCDADNDGEIFLRKIEQGVDPFLFLKETKCSFAGCWIEGGRLFAARNEFRPMHKAEFRGASLYCSTADIFARAGILGCKPLESGSIYVEG